MKISRFLSLAVLSACAGLFVTGCYSMPEEEEAEVTSEGWIEYESENPVVTLSVIPRFEDDEFFGFDCTFTNHGEKSARVVWDESSVNYNGGSYAVFLDGQRYSSAQNPLPPAVIPRGESITRVVFSYRQPDWNSWIETWIMCPIEDAREVQLLFSIHYDGKQEYIVATEKIILLED